MSTLSRNCLAIALTASFLIGVSAPSLACRACGAPAPIEQSEETTTDDVRTEEADESQEGEGSDKEPAEPFESPEGKPA